MEYFNSRPELVQFVKEVAAKSHIEKYEITKVETNQKGEGFLGEIFMVTIKNETTSKNLEILIKAAICDQKTRDKFPVRLSFENEIYFYRTVLPVFQKFEKEHELCNRFAAQCYHTTLNDSLEILALENLKTLGFSTISKKAILDDAHVRLIFENYGRFHAYSFALRDQQPELFAKIIEKMGNMWEEFLKNEMFGQVLDKLFTTMRGYLDEEEDAKVIDCFQPYLHNQIMDRFKQALDAKCKYPAILHGDCWSNNMLFKYEEADETGAKTPSDMRLIDFQIIRVASPVCDLAYCFYSGASKTELNRLDEYLEVYYKSFSSFLRQLGSDPDKLYPFDGLKEDWKKFAKFGIIMGANIMRMKLIEQADIIDLTDISNVASEDVPEHFANIKFDEKTFSVRTRDLLKHAVEYDVL